jgi:hypothetical protein
MGQPKRFLQRSVDLVEHALGQQRDPSDDGGSHHQHNGADQDRGRRPAPPELDRLVSRSIEDRAYDSPRWNSGAFSRIRRAAYAFSARDARVAHRQSLFAMSSLARRTRSDVSQQLHPAKGDDCVAPQNADKPVKDYALIGEFPLSKLSRLFGTRIGAALLERRILAVVGGPD